MKNSSKVSVLMNCYNSEKYIQNSIQSLINQTFDEWELNITNYNEIKGIINKQPKIDILINNAGNNIPEHFTKVKTKNMEYLVRLIRWQLLTLLSCVLLR